MFGEKPRLGYYPEDNRRLVSVTSVKEFTLGIPDQLARWIEKQTVLAMTRKQRELKRNLTQKEIIAFGKEARVKILEKARDAGIQAHQAIQNHNSQLPYELQDDAVPLFEAYLNWAKGKTIIPILEEYKVKNFDHGYAGRLDFYGKVDGRFVLIDFKATTIVDWSFGLQLAAYKKCLEDLGYQVDDMIILHLKPWVRGGFPVAEAHYFNTPFKAWEALLTLFHAKLDSVTQSEIEWYSRTDAAAIEAETKKDLTEVRSEQEFVHGTTAPGRPLETVGTSPSNTEIGDLELELKTQTSYPHQEDAPSLLPVDRESLLVAERLTSRMEKQLEALVGGISSHIGDSQPGIPLEGVIRLTGKPQILREPFELPSETDIWDDPQLSPQYYEKDNQQSPRQISEQETSHSLSK